jgi:hypothetical protein
MDAAILSTFSALAGTAIGALSSLSSTWMTTQSQARAARLAGERAKREDIYGRYMDGHIARYATPPVLESANRALRIIVAIALGPKRTPEEVRAMMDQRDADVIGAFAENCRVELLAIQ